MEYQRIYQKDPLPTYGEIRGFIGTAVGSFDDIIGFIEKNYDFEREIYYGGRKFGIMVRYRRKGKTLIQIFPEKDGYEVVLIYGKKEREIFESRRSEFPEYLTRIYDDTREYHDGKWMLIRIKDKRFDRDLKELIRIKKRPKAPHKEKQLPTHR